MLKYVVKQYCKAKVKTDVTNANCLSSPDGKIKTKIDVVKKIWKDYMEKLLNQMKRIYGTMILNVKQNISQVGPPSCIITRGKIVKTIKRWNIACVRCCKEM